MDNKTVSHEWIRKAEHDLGTARLVVEAGIPYADQVCYHSQQTAEKALKAILALYALPIPKTHDLMFLLDAVKEKIAVPASFDEQLSVLDGYSIDVRYPMGDFEPKDQDAIEALRYADAFLIFTSICVGYDR